MNPKNQARISKLLMNFTKTRPELMQLILSDNLPSISETLCYSFDDDLLITTQIKFRVCLDFLKIYDKFEGMKTYLFEYQHLELDVRKELETLFYGCLKEFGYKYTIGCDLSGIFVTTVVPVSIPIVDQEIKIWERYSFHQDGYLNLRSKLETKKKLCFLQGHVLGAERKIHNISKISTADCTNKKCANKLRLITIPHYQFEIEINRKTVSRFPLRNSRENGCVCGSCKSQLTKTREQVGVQYKYVISYNNRYIWASIPESTMLPESMSFDLVGVIGFLERDKSGRAYLNSSEYFLKTVLSYEDYIIKLKCLKVQKSKSDLKLGDYLKYCAEALLPFKRTIRSLDVIVLIIANIYNISDKSEIIGCCDSSYQNCLSLNSERTAGTPDSSILNTPDSVIGTDNKQRCSHRTIIYSNDISYIKSIIRSISNVTLLYSLGSFKSKSRFTENCICLLQISSKNDEKAVSLADHIFYIEVDHDYYHDYNYGCMPYCNLRKKDVILDQSKIRELKSLFIVQRKMFKNEIEPFKLLKTTEAIYRSISYFGNFKNISEFVKRKFRKIMVR